MYSHAVQDYQCYANRGEDILVELRRYNCPVPLSVVLKLMSYQQCADAEAPLRRLVQYGQVEQTYPSFFNPVEPYYSLTRLGCRAAEALVGGTTITPLKPSRSKYLHLLLQRNEIFGFDAHLGWAVCTSWPTARFCTREFADVFRACCKELQYRHTQNRLGSTDRYAVRVLEWTSKQRVHGTRREAPVYAHNVLKHLLIRGCLVQIGPQEWESVGGGALPYARARPA